MLSGQQNMGFIISVAKLGHGREIKKKKESKVRWDETQQGADMKRALITEMGNYYAILPPFSRTFGEKLNFGLLKNSGINYAGD